MNKWYIQITFGLFLGVITSGIILLISAEPKDYPVTLITPTLQTHVFVHIDGAVANPGLYQFPRDGRINDIVEMAGGISKEADTTNVNFAQKIYDGMKIYIPEYSLDNSSPIAGGAFQGTLNINIATKEQLDLLPEIGENKALAIIKYRNENGRYESIEELLDVPGIGPSILEKIQPFITAD